MLEHIKAGGVACKTYSSCNNDLIEVVIAAVAKLCLFALVQRLDEPPEVAQFEPPAMWRRFASGNVQFVSFHCVLCVVALFK